MMNRVENEQQERMAPSFLLPPGISPPAKKIVGHRIVNGMVQYKIQSYDFFMPLSLINFHGWTPEEWNAKNGNSPPIRSIVEGDDDDEYDGSINLLTYIKEQEGIISKQNEITHALMELSANPKTSRVRREQKLLLKWHKEIKRRRNRARKDWKPYNRNYEGLLPQYAQQSEH